MSGPDGLIGDIPGVGRPAARALAEQGLTTLRSLAGADWPDLAQLHGVGPAAGRRLQSALEEHGLSMREPPTPQQRTATFTVTDAGAPAATGGRRTTGTRASGSTRPTDISPQQFLEGLGDRRRREGAELLELFTGVTGEQARMWGPSMIGFGQYHYVYATGREGDSFRVGFSPRAADLALYGLQNGPRAGELLDRLGTHRRGAGCVWVRKLEDVDTDVLRELVAHAWQSGPGGS
ncbi:helix-hairpin-helix domain-containing protein [Brachybacterium sp. GCM10030267]|uniref:helix-hairpin-helix domain-containing protein n=1 Tax=Brachybacterium sp. GCM10030267 TaxID=3273381 RepID=UPI00360CDD3B